jgi:hypothetical protein
MSFLVSMITLLSNANARASARRTWSATIISSTNCVRKRIQIEAVTL